MNLLKTILLLAISLLFIGCGISKESKISAENLLIKIADSKKTINRNKDLFLKDKATKDMHFYVIEVEKLDKNFDNSLKDIGYIENQYKTVVTPILNENSSGQEQHLLNTVGNLNSLIRKAILKSEQPLIRAKRLQDIVKRKDEIHVESIKLNKETVDNFNKFEKFVLNAKKEFPDKSVDLEEKLSKIRNIKNNSVESLTSIETVLKGEFLDVSKFTNSYDLIVISNKLLKTESEIKTKKINELFHSYSKILVDMKSNYFVKVGRSSWDESSDWDSENTYIYSGREVSEKIFDYFDSVSDQDMGSLGGGLFSSSHSNQINTNFNQSAVDSLNIDARESMSSSDDSANFWIEELYTEDYHKYMIIEDGKKTETDWIKVSNEVFEKNIKNIGMELVSKPLGSYEEETINTPAPTGMSYVGNKHYGEWKTDSSGSSFWHYYGMWSFMNNIGGIGSSYSHNDYDSYRNNRRHNEGYYGSGGSTYGTYGSRTHKTGSRYAKSDYIKKNRSNNHGNIRSAGHSARGRGPGGGGK